MVFAQSVEHAVTFGDDVGGKGAGQPLHRLEQPAHRSVCALITQSRDEIDTVGHVCRPGSGHGKEGAFRRVGMDAPGVLATEETVEVTQRPQVCHHTDLAVHGHVDDAYPLALGDKIETS